MAFEPSNFGFGDMSFYSQDGHITMPNGFVVAEKDIEFVSVPGKDGSIAFDNHRYKNVTIPVEVYFSAGFSDMFREFASEMHYLSRNGYNKLRLPCRDDAYRLAVFKDAVVAEPTPNAEHGKAVFRFDCKPFWYLDSGDETIDITGATGWEYTNTSKIDSKPLIRLYGNSYIEMTIGARSMAVVNTYSLDTSQIPYVDVDCEAMTVSYNGRNISSNCTIRTFEGDFGFPVIPGNTSGVIRSGPGSSTQALITPRWVEL